MKTLNPLLLTDSYNHSMFKQYPSGTTNLFSYIEARGGEYNYTVLFGLQYYLMEYLSRPITRIEVSRAKKIMEKKGSAFNEQGFLDLIEKRGGHFPVLIRSVLEGTVVPVSNALVTVEIMDPEFAWCMPLIETSLLRAVWYGTTVATQSHSIKQTILEFLEKTGTPESIAYRLHDFGARGVSSHESACIGGAAHLVNFVGSDTDEAIPFIQDYYAVDDEYVPAWAPTAAMEHSTVTSWTRDGEADAYENMIDQFGKEGNVIAMVGDSYDILNMCDIVGTRLKQKIIDSKATIVVRPDSGHPATVVLAVIERLARHFGYGVNSKGYKVLPSFIRTIQGDGINGDTVYDILQTLKDKEWSADNVFFGMGGALLQKVDRDTQKWAMKCSAAEVNDKWRDVYKDPITDTGKRSKKGLLDLVYNEKTGEYKTIRDSEIGKYIDQGFDDAMRIVWDCGNLMFWQDFEEIRERAKKIIK